MDRGTEMKSILTNLCNNGLLIGGIFGLILAYMYVGGLDRQMDIDEGIILANKAKTKSCTAKQNEQVQKDLVGCTSRGNGNNDCYNWAIVKDCGDRK